MKKKSTYKCEGGHVETLVFVFGTQMVRMDEPMKLICECAPPDLVPHLGAGALAFQIVKRDVIDYRRGRRGPYQAFGPLRDPSGIYYPCGFFLSESHRLGLFPGNQKAIAQLLTEHEGRLRFIVVPDGNGHRVLPYWDGDVLLEEIPVPAHFPRAIDDLWFWPPGQIRFGLQPDVSLVMGDQDLPV